MPKTERAKVLVVVGPTASGKSDLAVALAKKLDGEIISADSRQIYKDLNIGSAKVRGRWRRGVFYYKNIPHYLLDEVPPNRVFTVSEFKNQAKKIIKNIVSRGKIPIVAGGTGFWVDSLIYDFNFPEVPPNKKLRRQLGKKTPASLFKILQKIDPERSRSIDKNNPRRLIRAIEIAKVLGKVPQLKKKHPYRTIWLGLRPPRKILEKNIAKRAKSMLKRGLVSEVKKLLQQKIKRGRIKEFGFEYDLTLDYLNSRFTQKEFLRALVKETWRYAVRQMRWFKRNREIYWLSGPMHTEKFFQTVISPFLLPKKKD